MTAHDAPSSGINRSSQNFRAALSMPRALGLAIVVFSPVLSAATVGALAGGVAGASAWLSVLAGTVVVACVGAAIVPFARRFVVSGALYSYIGHALGKRAGTLAGASLAIGYPVGMMAILGAFGLYAGSALSTTLGWADANGIGGQALLYVLGIGSAGLLAQRGLDVSTRLSIWLLVVSSPLILIILVANLFTTGFDFGSQFTFTGFSTGGFTLGIVLSTTFFVAFESSAATAEETENPTRTIPRLLILVPAIVGGIAVLATLLTVPALDAVSDAVAGGVSPISAMAAHAGLGVLANVADLCLAITCYAMVVGYMNYAPRVWAAMAADGLLPRSMSRLSGPNNTPGRAIVVLSVFSACAPLIGTAVSGGSPLDVYTATAALFPYLWVLPYALICVGVIVFLRRAGELTVLTVVAAVIGGVGFVGVYVNGLVNPTGTYLDAMIWVTPVAILAMLVVALVVRLTARRNTKEHT